MSLIKSRLQNASSFLFVLYGGLAAFCVYFSMYAFRKPYAAGTYESVDGWDIDFGFKALLVISQILGYALSKVVGVKIVSEMEPNKRAPAILLLISTSWVGLILFAILPVDFKFLGLFINGLPLGLIWGLVFAFLEGRRTTEVLGAILSASFIVSSGVVKSIAIYLMQNYGVSEFWMPAVTGMIFFPILFISVYGLSQIPAPTEADIAARTERKPMNGEQRIAFLNKYGVGIFALVAGYILLTIFRDFRDDFAVEIWAALGFKDDAGVLTASEIPVAIITLLAFAALIFIKDNLKALLTIQAMAFVGAAMIGLSIFAYQSGWITPLTLMIGTGTGLYVAYMPFGAMLFERLIAATKQTANAGFLIYVADASGYIGTVAMLIYKNFFVSDLDWLSFFMIGGYITSAVCMTFIAGSAIYFVIKIRNQKKREKQNREPIGLAEGPV